MRLRATALQLGTRLQLGTHARSLCAVPELVTTRSGLRYRDVGTPAADAPVPSTGDTVAVHYTGRLEDGTVFDSSHDRGAPIEFTLGEGKVIKGWDEGIASMRVRQRRQLVIEPHLGYGARGAPPTIPPNALLHFDVELVPIKPPNSWLTRLASIVKALPLK